MLKRIIAIIAISLTISVSVAYAQNAYELRLSWQYIAEMISATGRVDDAARILESVEALSDEELVHSYSQASLDSMIKALEDIDKAVESTNSLQALELKEKKIAPMAAPKTYSAEGFPTKLDYPDSNYCPLSPGRSNGLALQIAVDSVQVARIALEVAKGVWAGLSRGCEETVVILGEGGNLSLACIPADIVLFVAEGVVGAAEGIVEHFGACDNGVDSAEIEGTWKGVSYINGVLETHIGQLSSHDQDIKNEIVLINHKLDTQNGKLDSVLANQQIIIELLKTPSGKRPDWNK